MASNTPNLGLLKKDPATDGNETFNIKTMLNDNWDKIDEAVGNIQVPEASTTQKGIVQLSSATDGTREDVAATEKAVKAAYERGSEGVNAAAAASLRANEVESELDAHLADYVKHSGFAVSAGTATAYTVTLNPVPTSLVAGMTFRFKAHVDSGANPTINPNGMGAKAAKKANGNAASFKKDGVYTVTYDGILAFILQGEGGEYGTAGAAQVLAPYTIGTENGIITGTIIDRGTPTLQPGASIPTGYYGGGTVTESPHGEITYTTPGTYTFTVPIGVSIINYTAIGGGGGGGGGGYGNGGNIGGTGGGGGGGGGGWVISKKTVTPGQQINIVVGKGGSGGAPGQPATSYSLGRGVTGESGATSKLGTIEAKGGYGGSGGDSVSGETGGGTGG